MSELEGVTVGSPVVVCGFTHELRVQTAKGVEDDYRYHVVVPDDGRRFSFPAELIPGEVRPGEYLSMAGFALPSCNINNTFMTYVHRTKRYRYYPEAYFGLKEFMEKKPGLLGSLGLNSSMKKEAAAFEHSDNFQAVLKYIRSLPY